jgi:hypothetical protein
MREQNNTSDEIRHVQGGMAIDQIRKSELFSSIHSSAKGSLLRRGYK